VLSLPLTYFLWGGDCFIDIVGNQWKLCEIGLEFTKQLRALLSTCPAASTPVVACRSKKPLEYHLESITDKWGRYNHNLFWFIFFLFVRNARHLRGQHFNRWLRNHNLGASKLSKSPRDRTRPGPHQPLTWLDFWVSPPD
jgi:hypothetical protein